MTEISHDQNIIRNLTLNQFKIQEEKPSQVHLNNFYYRYEKDYSCSIVLDFGMYGL